MMHKSGELMGWLLAFNGISPIPGECMLQGLEFLFTDALAEFSVKQFQYLECRVPKFLGILAEGVLF